MVLSKIISQGAFLLLIIVCPDMHEIRKDLQRIPDILNSMKATYRSELTFISTIPSLRVSLGGFLVKRRVNGAIGLSFNPTAVPGKCVLRR